MPPPSTASPRTRRTAASPPPAARLPPERIPTPQSPEESSILHGLAEDGQRFEVPPTRDTLSMLCRITELPTLVTWFFMLFSLRLALPDNCMGVPVLSYFGYSAYPSECVVAGITYSFVRDVRAGTCCAQRCSGGSCRSIPPSCTRLRDTPSRYNVVLGIILDKQSRTQFITNYVREVSRDPASMSHAILRWLLRGTVYPPTPHPAVIFVLYPPPTPRHLDNPLCRWAATQSTRNLRSSMLGCSTRSSSTSYCPTT